MKWLLTKYISIRKSKINRNLNSNFTSTKYIIQETNSIFTFKPLNSKFNIIWHIKLRQPSAINHRSKRKLSLWSFLMITIRPILKNLYHNFLIVICIAQSICIEKNLIPRVTPIECIFSFWFKDWLIFSWAFKAIK